MAIRTEHHLQAIPIINTNPVDRSHRIIATNIMEDSLASRIQNAQVVILLRTQDSAADYSNGLVLSTHLKQNDCVLIEGNQKPNFLCVGIKHQTRSWEVKINPTLKGLFNEWIAEIRKAISLITRVARLVLKKHPSADQGDSDDEVIAQDLDGYKTQLQECLLRLKDIDSKYKEIMRNEFLAQSIRVACEIEKNLHKHPRIWVILGEIHGRYISTAREILDGVSYLYHCLENAKVAYITLKYFDRKLGPLDYCHSPNKAQEVEDLYEKELAEFYEDMGREIPPSLPVKQQYEVFHDFCNPWKKMPLNDAGRMIQLFLERALNWE